MLFQNLTDLVSEAPVLASQRFGFRRRGSRARKLICGGRRAGGRLQLGTRVLWDVGEIGRQNRRPNGRRFGLGNVIVWFGHGVSPRDVRLNHGRTSFVPASFYGVREAAAARGAKSRSRILSLPAKGDADEAALSSKA